MELFDEVNDELQIYRGKDYVINENIKIHQPTLNEIIEYGERKYFGMIYSIVATGNDLKWQLADAGIDYTKIKEFEIFCFMTYKAYSKSETSIIFGNLDLTEFEIRTRNDEEIVLYNEDKDIIIDEFTYLLIADYLRKTHNIKKDESYPANDVAKEAFIEDARDEYNMNKNKPYKSRLKSLISTLICVLHINPEIIFNMNINMFLDMIDRTIQVKNADLLLQSGYSGYGIDLKTIDDKKLNWFSELNNNS